ncbi:MAG TPA: hypothetical protein VFV05_02825 [Methylomirabilota bacterium]|nr:hypothetical protein [Methylomirabilota bacterium]
MTYLFIVSKQYPDVHACLAREFGPEPDVTVIVDRRHRQRRAPDQRPPADLVERRRADRRVRGEFAMKLEATGYAFVPLN